MGDLVYGLFNGYQVRTNSSFKLNTGIIFKENNKLAYTEMMLKFFRGNVVYLKSK